METTLSEMIKNYISERKQAKLEPDLKKLNRVIIQGVEEEKVEAKRIFSEAEAKWTKVFEPAIWLTDAAKRAKQISLSTHSAKFIHSDAKSSSCLYVGLDTSAPYLTTGALTDRTLDASGNAAALDVARLLKIQVRGRCLVDDLQEGHVDSLKAFSDDEHLHQQWLNGFSQALNDSRVNSHSLAKQVYFPVGSGEYQLLMPLYASSLAHILHQKINQTRFGEKAKELKDARRKNIFHEGICVNFPNTVEQSFGGSKPQNISQLNSERYGKNYLLPCAPPTWQSQTKPLFYSRSLLDKPFSNSVFPVLREFKRFLERLRPDQKTIDIRKRRDNQYLQPIIDAVFARAAHFQSLSEYAGWSEDEKCQLKPHYKLWLDTWNSDATFMYQREKNDWQEDVAQDFSLWLNNNLKHTEKYVLADNESQYWKKVFAGQLKAFEWATPKAELSV